MILKRLLVNLINLSHDTLFYKPIVRTKKNCPVGKKQIPHGTLSKELRYVLDSFFSPTKMIHRK